MKPFPSSIRVGGKRIAVVVSKSLENYGEYDHDKAEIRLSSRVLTKSSDLRETLRHEIMHAALAVSGISFMEKFEEEVVVRCFEEIFFPCWDSLKARYNF